MIKEKIAVIGAGISGLSASLLLSKKYEVHLFEQNNYLGGHTRTKIIEEKNQKYNIDTGFIVFNEQNYPDLVNFFKYLKINTENSNMSFSVSMDLPKIEYCSNILKSLLTQKKNFFALKFWLFFFEIFTLYNQCKKINSLKNIDDSTLEDFLNEFNYSKEIRDFHIYPIVSSIWSCDVNEVKKFPLISFINFFNNHKLFNLIKRPKWKFVKGGSKKYIDAIISKNLFNYKINKKVIKIIRNNKNITIIFNNNKKIIFNKIILAVHADQILKILDKPTNEESNILSKFKYSKNHAYLHSDTNFMPRSKFIWSSWNFLNNNKNNISFSLTYWMNLLQNIKSQKNYFVSINPFETPTKYYDKTIFEHPIFNLETLSAQKKIKKIQGIQNTWYCGSYCGYGFHEDGIQSAVYVAQNLGIDIPWQRLSNYYSRLQFDKNDR